MAKKIKPVTPGLRFRIAPVFDEITSSKPEKSLLKTLNKSGGRNSKGKMTARERIDYLLDAKSKKSPVEQPISRIFFPEHLFSRASKPRLNISLRKSD